MSKFLNYLKQRYKRIILICGIIVGSLFLIAALLVIAMYQLTPQLARYNAQVAMTLSELVERPVTVDHVAAEWDGLGPVIQLNNVDIWDASHQSIIMSADTVEIKVSVLDLIRKQALVPTAIYFNKPHVTVLQTPKGEYEIVGYAGSKSKSEPENIYKIIEKIIEQDRIEINNGKIDVRLSNGETLYLQDLNASLAYHFFQVRLEGSAKLFATTPQGEVNVLLTFDPHAIKHEQWNADLKLIVKEVNVPKWTQLWPSIPVNISTGICDMRIDAAWEENQLTEVNASSLFEQLAIQYPHKEANQALHLIELDSLSVEADGKRNAVGWLITTNIDVKPITGGDANIHSNLLLPENIDDAQIELYAKAHQLPAVETLNAYLPEGVLPDKLDDWLHEAIQGGIAEEVDVTIRGPVNKIPFANQEGLFEIIADVKDFDLRFNKDWLPLEKIQGQLIFRSNEFISIVNQGKIGGDDIIEAAVTIPDIDQPNLILNITGKVEGTAESTVAFLQQSPLWSKLSSQLDPLKIQGPVQLDLDLNIPLKDPKTKSEVFGSLDFFNATLALPAQDLTFTEMKGEITFDERGIYADQLSGKFYGQPITAQLASHSGTPGFLEVAIQGDMDIKSLNERFPNPVWADWTGVFPFAANLVWRHPQDPKPSSLQLTSNLKGANINLPAPFAKTATQEQAFIYTNEFSKTGQRLQVKYGKLLAADLYLSNPKNKNEITRGLVQIQPNKATNVAVPKQGVLVNGYLPTLDLDPWVALFQKLTKNNSSNGAMPAITANLKLDKVRVFEKDLAVNTLNIQKLSQQWKASFSGKDAQGQVLIPVNLKQKPIDISLNYLNWKTEESNQPKKDNPPPDNLPNFNVTIKRLVMNDRERGTLKLATQMGQKRMTINPLRLEHPDYTFAATARWSWNNTSSNTSLAGTVTAKNLGGMLKSWNINDGMLGGKGTTKLNLNWQGGPGSFDIDELKGEVIVDWRNGRLVSVKPGLGRILSLFSVTSLTRRLRLDFSDVFKKGFTFDHVTADMIFNTGTINTKNGAVDSTSGKIKFNGNLYTVSKTLDLYLQVIPMLPTTSIAAGVAVINPIAGAAAWATGKAVTPVTKHILSMNYHITGPWAEPIITDTKGNTKGKK
jgi:uncharacterized protein (TIGR02099 family)